MPAPRAMNLVWPLFYLGVGVYAVLQARRAEGERPFRMRQLGRRYVPNCQGRSLGHELAHSPAAPACRRGNAPACRRGNAPACRRKPATRVRQRSASGTRKRGRREQPNMRPFAWCIVKLALGPLAGALQAAGPPAAAGSGLVDGLGVCCAQPVGSRTGKARGKRSFGMRAVPSSNVVGPRPPWNEYTANTCSASPHFPPFFPLPSFFSPLLAAAYVLGTALGGW